MKARFRSKTFTIRWIRRNTTVNGEIGQIDRVININTNLSPGDILEAEIHEAMHACLPDIAEDAVDETAADIMHFLWRRGYRRK